MVRQKKKSGKPEKKVGRPRAEKRNGDRHVSAFLVRVPEELREMFAAARAKLGERYTVQIRNAMFDYWQKKLTPKSAAAGSP